MMPSTAICLQTLLERASFSGQTTVANGVDALQAAQAENAPRLLILDWMMPGMSGPESMPPAAPGTTRRDLISTSFC